MHRAWSGLSIMTSWNPNPSIRRRKCCRLRVGCTSLDSAANLLGMTRTAHGSLTFAGDRSTSGGVLLSFPGQNGHVSTNDATGGAGRCVANSSGRLALCVAMMTHSLVKKFWRSSGIRVDPSLVIGTPNRDSSDSSARPVSPIVIKFEHPYEPQNSYWYSRCHRRRRTAIHPDAGAPSLV